MLPGGMNPKQLKQMERTMKKMGMNMKDLKDVESVTITLKDKELFIPNAEVSIMNAMGQETYQIVGKAEEHIRSSNSDDISVAISDDDVDLVALQTGKDKDLVRKTLSEVKGDLAEAILRLS
ncbi:MAG: nascent polypeptide-associated complex protein [Methanobacteriaceae archaeon]|nr:nascent polypeptide-associated complex protein [Methanobacteriaceae archaeon]